MPEEKGKKTYQEINSVLERILMQNPQIILSRIELFTEVYYPIAILEMDMKENTFEDFEIVPFTVLKFVNAGASDAEEIARLMGLRPKYIQKMLDLLMGYGYLDENGVTPLGTEALLQERKISRNTVKQIFQADAVTGDLLKVGQQLQDLDLIEKEKTITNIAHMPHIEGITVESLNAALMQADLREYKKYRGSILNANAEGIENVRCVDLKYVRAYLVKLQGISVPFVITNQYDATKETYQERFVWQPIRVPDKAAYSGYGFAETIPCYSAESLKSVKQLYELVRKRIVDVSAETVRETLEEIYPFDFDTMDITMGRVMNGVPEQISVYINDSSFTKWHPFVLIFLEKFDLMSGYVYTHSRLNGLFIRFESQNVHIRKQAKTVQKIVQNGGAKELHRFFREKIRGMTKEEGNSFDFKKLEELLAEFTKTQEEKEE